MKRKLANLFVAAVVLPVALLTACGDDDDGGDYRIARTDNDSVPGSLYPVTVDGRECIVYDGANAGGLSCDWTTP